MKFIFSHLLLNNGGGFQGAPNVCGSIVLSPFHLSELALVTCDVQVGQHAETAISPPLLPWSMRRVTLHHNPCKCIFLWRYY